VFSKENALMEHTTSSFPDRSAEANQFDLVPPYQLIRARHGVMCVNVNDWYMGRAIAQYGECNEIETKFLLAIARYPNTLVEVGANMGIHTVPLAQLLAREHRRVVAFEPQPVLFQQLCANLALNGLMNVRAWPFACGSENSSLVFSQPDYRKTGNFGGVSMESSSSERGSESVPVPCVRLDDVMGTEAVGILKIDVEGFELEVLQGAKFVIKNSRPLIYVENDRVEKSQALIEWLWEADYKLWWHTPRLFNAHNFFGISENIYPNVFSINMFAFPKKASFGVAHKMVEITDSSFHPLKRA
jgi:FkbM family methyltransferase